MEKENNKVLSKSTPVTIGLVVMFIILAFFSGTVYGKLTTHVSQDVHQGVIDNYVSKESLNLQFRILKTEINASSEALEVELKRLNKVVEKLEKKLE